MKEAAVVAIPRITFNGKRVGSVWSALMVPVNELDVLEAILRRWLDIFLGPHMGHVAPIVRGIRERRWRLRRVEDEAIRAGAIDRRGKRVHVVALGRVPRDIHRARYGSHHSKLGEQRKAKKRRQDCGQHGNRHQDGNAVDEDWTSMRMSILHLQPNEARR